LDNAWYSEINNKENVLIMFAGVIYYFDESEVKNLFDTFKQEFKKSTIIFDYSSTKGVKIANKAVIEEGGMDKTAYLKWGTDNIYEIEKWNIGFQVDETIKMFAEHRKMYPFSKRFGMWISDALSLMSLAKITIN
jgi:O-methyltransferase involved in polyketide biosynthesis